MSTTDAAVEVGEDPFGLGWTYSVFEPVECRALVRRARGSAVGLVITQGGIGGVGVVAVGDGAGLGELIIPDLVVTGRERHARVGKSATRSDRNQEQD